MKRTLLLVLGLMLVACVPPENATPEPSVPTPTKTPEELAEEYATELEAELATERDTIKTLAFFDKYYMTYIGQKGDDVCWNRDLSEVYNGYPHERGNGFLVDKHPKRVCQWGIDGGDAAKEIIFKKTSQDMSIDTKCLWWYCAYEAREYCPGSEHLGEGSERGYIDMSDECIIARRNMPETTTIYFNFQKYLPSASKIKTEDQFMALFMMFDRMGCYWGTNCYKYEEITDTERQKCDENRSKFIDDMVLGKAPRCSVKYPTQYKKFKSTDFGAEYLCVPDEIEGYGYSLKNTTVFTSGK